MRILLLRLQIEDVFLLLVTELIMHSGGARLKITLEYIKSR